MLKIDTRPAPHYRFPGLSRLPGLVHGVSTREGGVSPSPYHSLNLGKSGDDPANVAANLERLAQALGLSRLTWVRQVHGTRVIAAPETGGPAGEADGLSTDRPGLGLLIKQADCQAVVLVHPAARVIACLHVGWRGNVTGMPGAGVRHLAETYGVDPAGLHAAVSPALGACCAEFVNYREELPPDFLEFRVGENHFDLVEITRRQLADAGVRPENIEVSGLCTKCRPEFFSYRREGVTGRFGTVVALV